MDEEARELVKRLLEEGKRYDDVRRALISHGLGTKGFEEEYPQIQKELGITEPPPTKIVPERVRALNADERKGYSDQQEARDISNMVTNIVKLLAGVLVIVGAVIMLSGYGDSVKDALFGDERSISELNSEDVVHETNLRTMQASAQSYKGRLTDYDGLCTSIGIDRETYTCRENGEAYAIESVLRSGAYYCVDSTGFAGVIEGSIGEAFSCE